MLINLSEFNPDKVEYVIIGTGPASISLAFELEKKNISCLLLEAGSFEYSDESQEYYEGKLVGKNYLGDIDVTRSRLFGGTSQKWGGMCRPFDESDFNNWPIDKNDLDSYQKKAQKFLNLENDFLPDKKINQNINLINFNWSTPTLRINNNDIKNNIKKSKFIYLSINSYVYNLNCLENRVDSVSVYDSKNNLFLKKKIKNIILGCGGPENCRLLLVSSKKNPGSFLNNSLIGRYFIQHPHSIGARSVVKYQKIKKFFNSSYESRDMFFLSPSKNFINNEKISNSAVRLQTDHKSEKIKDTIKDLLCVAPKYGEKIFELFKKKTKCTYIKFFAAWEQIPKFENHVSLDTDNLDPIGIPKIIIESNIGDKTKYSLFKFLETIGHFFIEEDFGRVGIEEFLILNGSDFPMGAYGGSHHMGGTKMGAKRSNSVVDKNLLFHDSNNLYVVGSSVFPSGGHANPTFTVCQLSYRLADYLEKKLKKNL